MLSLQRSDIDFSPIYKISLWDLSELIRKEKAMITARESHPSVHTETINPNMESPTATEVTKGPNDATLSKD